MMEPIPSMMKHGSSSVRQVPSSHGAPVFVRNVNVRNAACAVHGIIRFVTHEIRPDKVLTLGGCTGNVYRKLLRRWGRTLHAFAIIQNYFRNMRTEIKNFGNGIISSVHL